MTEPTASAGPLVTVVIPSVNGLPVLAECVQCLVEQAAEHPAEVIVVDRCGEDTRKVIRERFAQAVVIAMDGMPSIPAMRTVGIERARGRFVAIIEDHCLAEPGWLRAIEEAARAGVEAVGGPVENGAPERLVDWAVFFCEYTRFMGPAPRGVVAEIPGNNSAYERGVFARLEPELRAEVWESFLQARMRQLGVAFHSDPDMVVRHKKEFGYGYFLSQRYHYSRSFAGMRMAGATWWRRAGYACATAALPPLLLWRIGSTVRRKGRNGREFLLSLPILLTFLVSWAFGEAIGAVFGPGQSLARVE